MSRSPFGSAGAWKKVGDLRRTRAAEDETRAEHQLVGSVEREIQRALDIAEIQELLTNPQIQEGQKRFWEYSLKWLHENPGRSLAPSYQDRLRRTKIAIKLAGQGVERPEGTRFNRPRKVFPKKVDNRPAWMKDATLLPKGPPRKSSDHARKDEV